jgi:hypothetical protein
MVHKGRSSTRRQRPWYAPPARVCPDRGTPAHVSIQRPRGDGPLSRSRYPRRARAVGIRLTDTGAVRQPPCADRDTTPTLLPPGVGVVFNPGTAERSVRHHRGCVVARHRATPVHLVSAGSCRTRRPRVRACCAAHSGHPLPADRADIRARHSWPHRGHSQHGRRWEPAATSPGVEAPLRVGCHSAANDGWVLAKLVSVVKCHRAHTGHPLPCVRAATFACHSCPRSHCHHTTRSDP